jgi:hypothetical protein
VEEDKEEETEEKEAGREGKEQRVFVAQTSSSLAVDSGVCLSLVTFVPFSSPFP